MYSNKEKKIHFICCWPLPFDLKKAEMKTISISYSNKTSIFSLSPHASLSHSLTHKYTHTLTNSLTHTHTYKYTHTQTHKNTLTHKHTPPQKRTTRLHHGKMPAYCYRSRDFRFCSCYEALFDSTVCVIFNLKTNKQTIRNAALVIGQLQIWIIVCHWDGCFSSRYYAGVVVIGKSISPWVSVIGKSILPTAWFLVLRVYVLKLQDPFSSFLPIVRIDFSLFPIEKHEIENEWMEYRYF